jgi:hypothetical protein
MAANEVLRAVAGTPAEIHEDIDRGHDPSDNASDERPVLLRR